MLVQAVEEGLEQAAAEVLGPGIEKLLAPG